mgnify:CR=1 FL=1
MQRGFTVIEILIITVIVAVVSSVAVVSAFRYKASQDLRLTLNELSALIRDVQRKSVTQEDGKRWGVRFENAQSGKDRMYIFKGTSFASGTVAQSLLLRRSAQFGEPGPSSTRDIVFLPIEGSISPNKVITLTTGLADGLFGDIVVNLLGHVTTRTDTGIAGYWHFDEGTSTATYDASGKGNTGTFVGSPTWASGTNCKAGGCLALNGATSSVDIPDLSFSGDFTLMAWVKLSGSIAAADAIFGQEGTGQDVNFTSSRLRLYSPADGDVVIAGTPTALDAWTHYAITRNGSALALYYDGSQNASGTWSGAFTPKAVGRGNAGYLEGFIDEVRLYERALSAAEIANIYNDLK